MRQNAKKRLNKLKKFLFIFGIMLLAGCGRKEVEYNTASETDATGQDMNQDMLLKDIICAEDMWEEEIAADNGINIFIEASVEVPEVDGLKVVEIEEVYFDDKSADEFTKKFGGENVIKEDKKYAGTKLEEYSGNSRFLWQFYDEYYGGKKPDESADIEYDKIENVIVPICYTMKNNNNDYELLYFSDREKKVSVVKYKFQDMAAASKRDISDCEDCFCDRGGIGYKKDENLCSLTRDEVEKIALDFVGDLDIGDFMIIENYDLFWRVFDQTYEEYYDGAYVKLVRSIDGVEVNTYDYESNFGYIHLGYEENAVEGYLSVGDFGYTKKYEPETITMYINDSGVFYFCYGYPINITQVKAEKVKLLTYDKMKEYMRQNILNTSFSRYAQTNKLNRVQLLYSYVKDPDNETLSSLVPSWRLFGNGSLKFMINAIDGSPMPAPEPEFIMYH